MVLNFLQQKDRLDNRTRPSWACFSSDSVLERGVIPRTLAGLLRNLRSKDRNNQSTCLAGGPKKQYLDHF